MGISRQFHIRCTDTHISNSLLLHLVGFSILFTYIDDARSNTNEIHNQINISSRRTCLTVWGFNVVFVRRTESRRVEGDDTENRGAQEEKVKRKLNKRRKEIRATIFALERQLYFVKHRCISLIILVARSTLTLLLQKVGGKKLKKLSTTLRMSVRLSYAHSFYS